MDHTSLSVLAAMSANDSTQNIIRQAPATSAPSATSHSDSQDMRPNPLASHSLCAQHYGSSNEPSSKVVPSHGDSQDIMRSNLLASHSLNAQHYGSSDEPRTGAPAVESSNDASNGGGFTYKW